MRKGKASYQLLPHYSGGLSHKFWAKVNSVKGKKGGKLYSMGCILQNLEGEVLEQVNEVKEVSHAKE